jgi:regulatory protein
VKVTDITAGKRDPNRVNVYVDGKYRFSLDIFQVADLGLKVGREYTDDELAELERQSQLGKLYARALEYTMLRPHSEREVRDYLWRKTRPTRKKDGSMKEGVSPEVADQVLHRLVDKGYIDDQKFARYWIENRSRTKGASRRKLQMELRAKGVAAEYIDMALGNTERDELDDLRKVVAKKRARYADEQKFMAYLAGQGFSYDDIKTVLNEEN